MVVSCLSSLSSLDRVCLCCTGAAWLIAEFHSTVRDNLNINSRHPSSLSVSQRSQTWRPLRRCEWRREWWDGVRLTSQVTDLTFHPTHSQARIISHFFASSEISEDNCGLCRNDWPVTTYWPASSYRLALINKQFAVIFNLNTPVHPPTRLTANN